MIELKKFAVFLTKINCTQFTQWNATTRLGLFVVIVLKFGDLRFHLIDLFLVLLDQLFVMRDLVVQVVLDAFNLLRRGERETQVRKTVEIWFELVTIFGVQLAVVSCNTPTSFCFLLKYSCLREKEINKRRLDNHQKMKKTDSIA